MKKQQLFFLASSLSIFLSGGLESFSQQLAKDKPQIAVLDLEGRGASVSETASLTDRLRTHLVNTAAFVVLDRGNMEEILNEFNFQQSGCTTAECAVEIGKMLNVQKMVTGSIGQIGKTYTIDISVVDVESSRIERSLSQDYRGEIDGLLEALKAMAYELAGIEESAPRPAETAKAPPVETKRLYILKLFSTPPGAEVIVNGRSLGKTPLVRKAAAGASFTVQLSYPGYQDWEKALMLLGDQELKVDLVSLRTTQVKSSYHSSSLAAMFGRTVKAYYARQVTQGLRFRLVGLYIADNYNQNNNHIEADVYNLNLQFQLNLVNQNRLFLDMYGGIGGYLLNAKDLIGIDVNELSVNLIGGLQVEYYVRRNRLAIISAYEILYLPSSNIYEFIHVQTAGVGIFF
jgi:TolB-like protein